MLTADLMEAAAKKLSEPTDEDGYVYHGTTLKNIQSIKRDGLVAMPQAHEDEDRAHDEPAVFFTISPARALRWGPVCLRFPWPDSAEPDPYGDTTMHKGEVLESNWYTFEDIPVDAIEVWRNGTWQRI